jgi:hypothetical protein
MQHRSIQRVAQTILAAGRGFRPSVIGWRDRRGRILALLGAPGLPAIPGILCFHN